MDICLVDIIQQHTREISVENDGSLSIGVDERVDLFVPHHGTYDDARPTVENDGFPLVEILCDLGVADLDSLSEVVRLFVVEQVEEGVF